MNSRKEHQGHQSPSDSFECIQCGYTVPDADDPLYCATCARMELVKLVMERQEYV